MSDLIDACCNNNTKLAKTLITCKSSMKINLDFQRNNRSALIWVGRYNNTELCKMLIENGANLDLQDPFGQTALMYACYNKNVNMARILITYKKYKGTNLDIQDKDGKTALMLACYNDNTKIINILINKKANLDLQDNDGRTALEMVCCWNVTKIAIKLINSGANLNLQDNDGYTALMCACKYDNTEIVSYLIEHI